jgi:polyadenylation factor subunit 2
VVRVIDRLDVVEVWSPDETLTGHNWDVKSCDWHPTKGLIVSGSKDHQVKCLVSRRSSKEVAVHTREPRRCDGVFVTVEGGQAATLTGHNWDVKSCDWHPTKGLIVSGSKDHQVKFWDRRPFGLQSRKF